MNDLAGRFLEQTANQWLAKGLPLAPLARAMMAMGTACMEGADGLGAARQMVDTIGEALEDKAIGQPPQH